MRLNHFQSQPCCFNWVPWCCCERERFGRWAAIPFRCVCMIRKRCDPTSWRMCLQSEESRKTPIQESGGGRWSVFVRLAKAIGKCSGVWLNCIRPRDDASLMGHSALNWLQWIVSCYVPLGSLVVTTFGVLDSFWWHRSNKIYDAYLANGRIARKLRAGHQIVDNELIGDSNVSFQYSRTCHGRIFFSNQKTIYWLVV